MDTQEQSDLARVLTTHPLDLLAVQAEIVAWLMLDDAAAQAALARAHREVRFDGLLHHWDFVRGVLRSLDGFLAVPAELRAEAGADIARDTGMRRVITRRDVRRRRRRPWGKQ